MKHKFTSYLRVPVAKLGASADPLRIEAGRYALPTPLPVEERTAGIVPTRLRMNPSHVNLPKQQWIALLFDHCSTLNPASSNMTSTDRMVFTIIYTNVLKSLGHHVIYALNVCHKARFGHLYAIIVLWLLSILTSLTSVVVF